MDLSLEEMHAVVTLAGQLHFGRAAALLHISQPALTKQIHKIERTLGGPLFLRKPRQLTLTRAGEVLVRSARPLLRESELAADLARRAMRGEAGLLRIGFGIASLATGLPDLIQRFRSTFPAVQIAMRDMSTPAQLDALENQDLDVGFVRLPVARGEIAVAPILSDRLVIALGPRSRCNPRLGLRALAREPFVAVARGTSASHYDHVLRTCRAAGFTPRIVQEVDEIFTALSFVRAGAGVALVPNSSRFMHVPRIRFLETRVKAASWEIGLAWRKSAAGDPALHNFISLVRQSFHRS